MACHLLDTVCVMRPPRPPHLLLAGCASAPVCLARTLGRAKGGWILQKVRVRRTGTLRMPLPSISR